MSIVIPAYNEEKRLPHTLAELQRYGNAFPGDFEVIVVDDGSTDGTCELTRSHASTMPWLVLLERPHRGKGAAVRDGMLAAKHGRVVLCDADLSMPVEQLDRLLEGIEQGCDIAIGSRALPQSHLYQDPLKRRIMSRVFNVLVRWLVVGGVKDTQCGFKAFKREVAQDLFSRQTLDGFSFDVEIVYLARKRRYKLEEIAIDWYFDTNSRVQAGRDTMHMVADLLRIRRRALAGGYASTSWPRMDMRARHGVDVMPLHVEAVSPPAE